MSSAVDGSRFTVRQERVVLLTLATVQFTSIVDFMVVMPLGSQLMETLHIDPTHFGLVVSAYTLSAGVAGLVASSLVDRFARKRAFLTLYVGFLIGTLLCGLAPSYETLLAARLFTGAFGGILGGMALAIIGDVFPEHKRGRATGTLMTAFAMASVLGVPVGLDLGTRFGWHAPFLILAAVGVPVLFIAGRALPTLDEHVGKRPALHPLRSLAETFSEPNHLRAFALISTLMIGGFSVYPFMSPYLNYNVGLSKLDLRWVYVGGGVLTFVTTPYVGKLADRHGKLRIYRIVAPLSAVFVLAVTHLPPVHLMVVVLAVATFMASNAARMTPAMAMVTSSVEPHRRGGFLSANAAVQHLSAAMGSAIGGFLVDQASEDSPLNGFSTVGWVACASTVISLWLAGRLRIASDSSFSTTARSLGAAAEALADAPEPYEAAEMCDR